MTTPVPIAVLVAYGFDQEVVQPLRGGLINETYLIGPSSTPRAVLQKLHPVFEPEVNLDIDAITSRLADQGLVTPRLVRTRAGDPWHGRWRALTFVPGQSVDAVSSPDQAFSAAQLVGQFHAALAGWDHRFAFARAGAHDTSAHLARLVERLDWQEPFPGTLALAASIASSAAAIPAWPALPRRICHGDLKISNIRFTPESSERALCLLDLDTLGYQTLPYELGDAMRSWCNRASEDSQPTFDHGIFEAAIRGYRTTMPDDVTIDELEAIVSGTIAVCFELAARFCSDIFDDSYFGWDPEQYPSRRAHNHARATAMAALGGQVLSHQKQLSKLVQEPSI